MFTSPTRGCEDSVSEAFEYSCCHYQTKAEWGNVREEVVATAKMEVDKARAESKFAASKVVEDITLDFSRAVFPII